MRRGGDACIVHLRESFCSLGENASNIANLALLATVLKCLLCKVKDCVANSAKNHTKRAIYFTYVH